MPDGVGNEVVLRNVELELAVRMHPHPVILPAPFAGWSPTERSKLFLKIGSPHIVLMYNNRWT